MKQEHKLYNICNQGTVEDEENKEAAKHFCLNQSCNPIDFFTFSADTGIKLGYCMHLPALAMESQEQIPCLLPKD
jgi:hypothetical protein